MAYDPYGDISYFDASWTVRSGSSYANNVGFTGRWHDSTGMIYFRARMYDPVLGRFVQRDPARYVDGMSLYCGYMVPCCVDPSGLTITYCNCMSDADKKTLQDYLEKIRKADPRLKAMVEHLEAPGHTITLCASHKGDSSTDPLDPMKDLHVPQDSTVTLNLDQLKSKADNYERNDQSSGLAHELQHADDIQNGVPYKDYRGSGEVTEKEQRAVRTENLMREKNGDPGGPRLTYEGNSVDNPTDYSHVGN